MPPSRPQPALTADPGLCGRCIHLQLLSSARSTFVRCGLAASDPSFPRYPALPVRSCPGFEEREKAGRACYHRSPS